MRLVSEVVEKEGLNEGRDGYSGVEYVTRDSNVGESDPIHQKIMCSSSVES